MINEQDFDVAASDICNRVVMISDPRLVVTIEKWLSKLTSSENRGNNELNYLKLLQYMVANKRIGRPFVREPPLGPLLPLSRYINPPSCSRLLARHKSRVETGWRTVSCTRASQTVEQDYDNFDDSADYYGGGASQSKNGGSVGASQSKNGGGGNTSLSKNGGGSNTSLSKNVDSGTSLSKNGDDGASLSKNDGGGASLSKNESDDSASLSKTGGSGASLLKNGSDGGSSQLNNESDSGASLSKNGSDGGSSQSNNGGNGTSLSKDGDQDKDADVDNDHRVNTSRELKMDDENRVKETTFDGHLAGGECDFNWGPTKCGGGERNTAMNIDQMAKFCNPCLDNLGQYKKHVHEPIVATYRNLLEDCKFPAFTEAERNSVSPELFDILNNVNDSTTLQDFYSQVSLYTCDQGELLTRVSNGMLDEFREFVTDVFDSRAEHISDGLANEQMLMNDKYTYLEHRMLNRATVALEFLREAMPVFNWYKYRDGVDAYMKRLILSWQTSSAAAAASGDADVVASAGGTDDGEDKTDVQRSAAQKKLLYTLNRQRSDVTRAVCKGKRLYEQRNGLLITLAESNAKLSAVQCQTAADVDRLKDELALLQRQTADQTIAVDQLMETTQLAMQNKKHSLSPSTSCSV